MFSEKCIDIKSVFSKKIHTTFIGSPCVFLLKAVILAASSCRFNVLCDGGGRGTGTAPPGGVTRAGDHC